MFDKQKASKPRQATESAQDVNPTTTHLASAPAMSSGKVAVIGPGIEIDGSIGGSENLLVEGQVKGSIELASYEVTVGKSGKVNADITGRIIKISGQVRGDLTGEEKVVIAGSGNVRGNVKAPRVVLEDGAIFKGSIDMDPGESATVKAVESRQAPRAAAASTESGKAPDLALKSGG